MTREELLAELLAERFGEPPDTSSRRVSGERRHYQRRLRDAIAQRYGQPPDDPPRIKRDEEHGNED